MRRRLWMGRPRLMVLALAATIGMTGLSACEGEREGQVSGGERERQVSAELAAQLQEILDSAVESPETVFPGTALSVSQPELGTWAGAAGEGNIDPVTPIEAADTFRAGSIVKPFVAVAILQLVEEGEFALDDPVPTVLPEEVVGRFVDTDRVTVRMLLNHTSGLPEYVDEEFYGMILAEPDRVWQVEEFLDLAAEKPPAFAPGEGYAYSNTDYNLLGLIIEEATGESWRAVVRERIIDPLDLDNTSLPEPGGASIGSGAAHGYELSNGELLDMTDLDSSMVGAAGGHALVTTTEDLVRFVDALLAGELFDQAETLEDMLTFVDATGAPGLVGYGLGLERYEFPGGVEVIGHLGTSAGYRAFVGNVPAQDLAIAMIITNPDDYSPVLLPALELMVAEAS